MSKLFQHLKWFYNGDWEIRPFFARLWNSHDLAVLQFLILCDVRHAIGWCMEYQVQFGLFLAFIINIWCSWLMRQQKSTQERRELIFQHFGIDCCGHLHWICSNWNRTTCGRFILNVFWWIIFIFSIIPRFHRGDDSEDTDKIMKIQVWI